ITACDKNAIRNQIFRSLSITQGRGLLLTPGCVIRYPINQEMLDYVRRTKEEIEDRLFAER
ncbi:MAG: uroporphyrinogen decarboxylase, partial [Oscillospiraceae bacterium]